MRQVEGNTIEFRLQLLKERRASGGAIAFCTHHVGWNLGNQRKVDLFQLLRVVSDLGLGLRSQVPPRAAAVGGLLRAGGGTGGWAICGTGPAAARPAAWHRSTAGCGLVGGFGGLETQHGGFSFLHFLW